MNDHRDRLMDSIRALVRRFSLAERADLACCGMTVAQAATLETLEHEDDLRLGTLARRLGIDKSTLTRNVSRLKDIGLVDTTPDPSDRRATVARLTEDGHVAAQRIARIEAEFARSVSDALGPAGAEETLHVLDRLLAAVRSASEGCCPGAFDHLMTHCSTEKGITPP